MIFSDLKFETLLKRLGQHKPQGLATTPCPGDDVLAAYLDGDLSSRVQDDVTTHLADCPDCRRVALAAAGIPRRAETEDPAAILDAEPSALPQPDTSRPNIMVVDDDPISLDPLKGPISRESDVIACTDKPETLRHVNEEVQVVVIDIKMADRNSLELAGHLKRNP